jgi:spore germination protein KB
MKHQLSSRQICLFLIAFLPVTKIFILPSVLANTSSEVMWISAIISLTIDFITLIPVVFACKKADKPFFQLLENALGKGVSRVILILYFIYFMLKSIVPLNEQKDYVELTLYTLMPTVLYFIPFFFVAFYLCAKKLRVLGRAADVMWLITIVGFIILFALSVTNADFGAILPIGAQGVSKVLSGSFNALNWFGDCVYIMFFIGEFKYSKKDTAKILLSFVLAAVLVIFFMVIFYCIFTSIAFRQRFALTEISKYTTVINNLGRFDYIGILLILFSNMVALSLPMYFSCRILNRLFNIKNKWIAPILVVGCQLAILLIFGRHFASIEYFMETFAGYFFIIMANVLPIFSVFLTRRKNNEIQQG